MYATIIGTLLINALWLRVENKHHSGWQFSFARDVEIMLKYPVVNTERLIFTVRMATSGPWADFKLEM